MDLQCDQVELHSKSRLKIRRAPSCKVSATSSSSFHGSCRQKSNNIYVRQPLIVHTVEPEIIKTEPAEFMWVVQRLTGSPHTRRLLRTTMQRPKEMQSSLQVNNVQLMQQGIHSLKEGTTTMMTTTTSFMNDLPPPSTPKPKTNQDLSSPLFPASSCDHNIYSHPLASPSSSDTNQLNLKANQPSSSFSSNSGISAITPMSLPLSANSSNNKYSVLPVSPNSCKFGITLSAKAGDELRNTRGPPCSPVSPTSSLTTTSEGYHTDNLSTEGGTWEALWFEQGNTSGSINFFDFTLDSFDGNYNAAQADEVEFHHSNVLDCFYD